MTTNEQPLGNSQHDAKLPVSRSKPCSEHKPNDIGLLQWYYDVERREIEGQKQKQCSKCLYWFWEDEY